jgi:hypothetical protein
MPQVNFNLSPLVKKKLRELNLNADDVLREKLEIKSEGFDPGKGVGVLPEGTVFTSWFKDKMHIARVKNGALVVDGDPDKRECSALSAAAEVVTGRHTSNGWELWMQVKFPNSNNFIPLKSLIK